MLSVVNYENSRWDTFLADDPVRPHIPHYMRFSHNTEYYVLSQDLKPQAICCVAYIGGVPKIGEDLFKDWASFNVAVFYTVWSYDKGSGRDIIIKTLNRIKWFKPFVNKAVTLSPKTDMARKFHLRNGAF